MYFQPYLNNIKKLLDIITQIKYLYAWAAMSVHFYIKTIILLAYYNSKTFFMHILYCHIFYLVVTCNPDNACRTVQLVCNRLKLFPHFALV